MKKKLLSFLLIFSLLLTLAPGAFATRRWTEVTSAAEMAAQLVGCADAVPQSAASAQPDGDAARVLLFADTLPDDCGAQRVLHYAAYHEFVLEFDSESAAQAAYETLTARYGVADCWLDAALDGAEPFAAETDACESWGAAVMGLDTLKAQAGLYVPESRRVTVAVIDTGADLTIPQLRDRAISASSYDFVDGTSVIQDQMGHGTTVASLLADLTPDHVELLLLTVFDSETGKAQRATVLTALQYALEAGADVISMSLGWEGADATYTFLNDVLDQANQAHVPVICAAGNKKADVQTVYPANYSTTIAVSAFDRSLTFASAYSSHGALLDFSAPGSSVQTGAIGGGSATTSGTSLAAPHITAAAADILLAEPTASVSQVYQTLRMYSQDLGAPGKDNDYGWGCPVMTTYFHDVLCPELTFTDMVAFDDWAHKGLDYCLRVGVIDGLPGARLDPTGTTTRAQFVTMLWRLRGEPAAHGATPFTDLTQDWYRDAVAWAVANGVTDGVAPTKFDPNGTVTREQIATFLYRYAKNVLRQDVSATADLSGFPDAAQVSAYAVTPMAWANAGQLVCGVGTDRGDYLQPQADATRAQVATILMRLAGTGA